MSALTGVNMAQLTFGITRWKVLPAKPNPFWPVASSRKFRAVFGTTSSKSLNAVEKSDENIVHAFGIRTDATSRL